MKKICMLLIALFAIACVSCSNGETETSTETATETSTETSIETSTETPVDTVAVVE